MKQTITKHDFRDAFQQIRPDNFSYEGLGLLFDWLEDYEESTGVEIELDVIAICCEFCESSLDEIVEDYDYPADDIETHLAGNTNIVGVTSDGNYVYQAF